MKSSGLQTVFIWDVETDKSVKQLDLDPINGSKISILPNGSQIASADDLGIKVIDASTGHPVGRQITPYDDNPHSTPWLTCSPNRVSASTKISNTKKSIVDLACSPDSSKVIAILRDEGTDDPGDNYSGREMTLFVWGMRSGLLSLVGTIPFELATRQAAISFSADDQNILICGYDLKRIKRGFFNRSKRFFKIRAQPKDVTLLRFNLEAMQHPPKFDPSRTPLTIQYSRYISGAIDNYASHVDANGWILTTKGEREIWTPLANYELSCSYKPLRDGQTQYRTLEVKDPETKAVVLIYIIAFEQEDRHKIQATAASVNVE